MHDMLQPTGTHARSEARRIAPRQRCRPWNRQRDLHPSPPVRDKRMALTWHDMVWPCTFILIKLHLKYIYICIQCIQNLMVTCWHGHFLSLIIMFVVYSILEICNHTSMHKTELRTYMLVLSDLPRKTCSTLQYITTSTCIWCQCKRAFRNMDYLVASSHLKNISQIASFHQVRLKLKNSIWNRHL